jgi:hypothetical protein
MERYVLCWWFDVSNCNFYKQENEMKGKEQDLKPNMQEQSLPAQQIILLNQRMDNG